MAWVDWLLNLAGLFLWLSWRRFGAPDDRPGALTLASNLRPAGVRSQRLWWCLPALLALLVLRAWGYHTLSPGPTWVAQWSPGPVTVSFRSDSLVRMLWYSGLSWLHAWWVMYLWFGTLAGLFWGLRELDPLARAFRRELGWFGRWPLPFVWLPVLAGMALLWVAAARPLAAMGLVPARFEPRLFWQQAVVIGLGIVPTLKWPLAGACALRFVLDHVYLGRNPLWSFAQAAGGRLARLAGWLPLQWGTLDFRPLAVGAVIWALAYFLEGILPRLFLRLPL
jgi:hypothetical protein